MGFAAAVVVADLAAAAPVAVLGAVVVAGFGLAAADADGFAAAAAAPRAALGAGLAAVRVGAAPTCKDGVRSQVSPLSS